MSTTDPAHPPRPGEGTGPLSAVSSDLRSAHTTGPLPPLPAAGTESPFLRALRTQLAAINDGRNSLREGLSLIISGLIADLFPDEDFLGPDVGAQILKEVPDLVIRFWLGKVASEEVTLEVFLGALTAEGLSAGMRKTVALAADMVQRQAPGTEEVSSLAMLNAVNQYDEVEDDFRQMVAERVAMRAADELKAGLDAQTANQLLTLLRTFKA